MNVYTVGYEGLALEEFLLRLRRARVQIIVDVRDDPAPLRFGGVAANATPRGAEKPRTERACRTDAALRPQPAAGADRAGVAVAGLVGQVQGNRERERADNLASNR